jgi:hypothetical protein
MSIAKTIDGLKVITGIIYIFLYIYIFLKHWYVKFLQYQWK